jgi:hypothetical protein
LITWEAAGPWITAAIAAAMTLLSTKIQHKGKPENALIDQLQEQLNKVELRMAKFEARDRVYIPHIIRLNMHIEQGLGPPAPKIPKVIQEYLDELEDEG